MLQAARCTDSFSRRPVLWRPSVRAARPYGTSQGPSRNSRGRRPTPRYFSFAPDGEHAAYSHPTEGMRLVRVSDGVDRAGDWQRFSPFDI